MAEAETLGVLLQLRGSRLAGKLGRGLGLVLVGQRATEGDGVLARGIHHPVEAADVGAVVQLDGRVEEETGEVQALVGTGLGRVADRELLEVAQHRGGDTLVERIHVGDIAWAEGVDLAVGGGELDLSILQRFAGNRAALRRLAGVDAAFIVQEVEQPALLHRAAQGGSELVADQRRARHTGAVVEPVVGRVGRVAVVFVSRAVQLIGAAARDQGNLAAGGTPRRCTLAGDGDAEFLHRIKRHRQRRRESRIAAAVQRSRAVQAGEGILVVVVVHAIQRDVVLVAAGTHHLAVLGDAGFQTQQLHHVSGLQRQAGNLFFLEGIADRGVHSVQDSGFGHYANR